MAFTGKATYSAGATLPELTEDVSDIVGIVSPYETPLLNALGDPMRAAMSTHHEWMEDSLLPNQDWIDDAAFVDPESDTEFTVTHGDRFRTGDQIQAEGSEELMLVVGIEGNDLTVIRGYAGTLNTALVDGQALSILGNAALEGDEKPEARFTNRTRKGNYTQIFTATVEVSGSDLAARQAGVADELDYQKQERLRELLRDLENTVINGGQPASTPEGSSTVRRTMQGILGHMATNRFYPGQSGMPAGTDLDEEKLNWALRQIWESSNGRVDLIVVNGFQKRQINAFMSSNRAFGATDQKYSDLVSTYESDFGLCRIVVSRWIPRDAVLLLDSSRISVLPLSGRSFHYKPLAPTGDFECGQLIGEYTLELKNEEAHGCIRMLSVS